MTKDTFTNDRTGEKFERLEPNQIWQPGHLVIKPIPKAVEKKHYQVLISDVEQDDPPLYFTDHNLTPPQAQAITDMLEAAMEGLQDTKMQDFPNDLADKFIKARTAVRNG